MPKTPPLHHCWHLFVLLLAAGVITACAPRAGAPGAEPGPAALLASLQAYTAGDTVTLVLQVTNTTDTPIEIGFNSGQSYDFTIERDGRELWRWSADHAFTQALRTEVLDAGATLRYEEFWPNPDRLRGEFSATGTLTSRDHPLSQTIEFDLE